MLFIYKSNNESVIITNFKTFKAKIANGTARINAIKNGDAKSSCE